MILSPVHAQRLSDPDFTEVVDGLLERSVPVITVDELKQREDVTILDARPAEEYEVSHLKGATRVGFQDFDASSVKDLPRDKPVVIYCSVGYRSERIAEKLEKLGFRDIYNLYGGIFEWYNLGEPVYDSKEEETQKVHPYDRNWGKWVKPRSKSDSKKD